MERSDKIMLALGCAAFIVVLLYDRSLTRVNLSTTPDNTLIDIGPAYLLSNLPSERRGGSIAPAVGLGYPS